MIIVQLPFAPFSIQRSMLINIVWNMVLLTDMMSLSFNVRAHTKPLLLKSFEALFALVSFSCSGFIFVRSSAAGGGATTLLILPKSN